MSASHADVMAVLSCLVETDDTFTLAGFRRLLARLELSMSDVMLAYLEEQLLVRQERPNVYTRLRGVEFWAGIRREAKATNPKLYLRINAALIDRITTLGPGSTGYDRSERNRLAVYTHRIYPNDGMLKFLDLMERAETGQERRETLTLLSNETL